MIRWASARSQVRLTSTPPPTRSRSVDPADHTTHRGAVRRSTSVTNEASRPRGIASARPDPAAYPSRGPTTSATSGAPETLSLKGSRDPDHGLAKDLGRRRVVEPRMAGAHRSEGRAVREGHARTVDQGRR